MKRVGIILLAIVLIVGLCLLVSACGGSEFPQT